MVGGVAFLALAFALGLAIGSFLNVVVHRVPRGVSLVRPGSRCPACLRPVRPLENVPLLSFVWLRGRCRGCRARIAWRYPAVELATGCLFALIAWRHGPVAATPVFMGLAALLLAAALIDYEHQWIPDEISLGGLVAGLLLMPLLLWQEGLPPGEAARHSAGGAFLGGGLLWLVGFLHARVSVASGRRFEHWPGPGEPPPRPGSLDYWTWFPGMGFGDVKLMAMIGAFLGPLGVVRTVVAASALGLVFGLALVATRGRWDRPFGFAPALAAGALVTLLLPPGRLAFGL
jgi:leader peptidase (prepilin peptidase)/N-methyltransferase